MHEMTTQYKTWRPQDIVCEKISGQGDRSKNSTTTIDLLFKQAKNKLQTQYVSHLFFEVGDPINIYLSIYYSLWLENAKQFDILLS